ncbi:hypothetical protein M2463_002990 [Parabacteroides sp. PH5-13]|nr:hypothetical protein [Parabacteroides sp. PH5-39]MDH6320958.1 hypothetical protein [Parabacteroides sp. PH5-13]MDH6324690.1 hypothetical protein [Parabacteroides sp. PH5-8]MDH6385875.1 hypothetical protein [Parabacteroides sp. PH5-17]MDH6395158.1 hypothetical protein [Parabacteroides sp. PFB2-22]MDH6408340.1 hypothetical protein [Parabacteroides sp. PH5-26]
MRSLYRYIWIVLALPALWACSGEEKTVITEPEGKEERVTIYFNSMGPATYALDFEKESRVETIDILAFKGSGSEAVFAFSRQINDADMDTPVLEEATGVYKRSFEVELVNDGEQYTYVFLANARVEISACLSAYPSVVEKGYLLSHLVASNTSAWNTGTDYKRLPMWGEYGPATPKTLDGKTIDLIRAVARVDVSVTAANFTISAVYVKNQYNHGRIVPETAKWNATDKKVTEPSLPLSGDYTGSLVNSNPLQYATAPRSIYLFETELPSDNNYTNTTHLIIKGALQGKGETYYRADFKDFFTGGSENNGNGWEDGPPATGSGSGGFVGSGDPYRRLLRNHHYQMNIISVAGEGYSSIDLASANPNSQRMLSEYINWNDRGNQVDVGNVSYSFDVSRTKISFNSQFTQDFIVVKTNYPGAWEVENTNAWFSCIQKEDGIEVNFTGNTSIPAEGSFNILLKSNGQVKFTKKIQVTWNND